MQRRISKQQPNKTTRLFRGDPSRYKHVCCCSFDPCFVQSARKNSMCPWIPQYRHNGILIAWNLDCDWLYFAWTFSVGCGIRFFCFDLLVTVLLDQCWYTLTPSIHAKRTTEWLRTYLYSRNSLYCIISRQITCVFYCPVTAHEQVRHV